MVKTENVLHNLRWLHTWVTVSEAVCHIWNYLQNKDIPTNSHSTKRHLKHSTNVEYTENVQSSNVVECNCKLRDIRKQDMMGMWVHTMATVCMNEASKCAGNGVTAEIWLRIRNIISTTQRTTSSKFNTCVQTTDADYIGKMCLIYNGSNNTNTTIMLTDDALHSSILFKLLVFAGWAAKRVSRRYKNLLQL